MFITMLSKNDYQLIKEMVSANLITEQDMELWAKNRFYEIFHNILVNEKIPFIYSVEKDFVCKLSNEQLWHIIDQLSSELKSDSDLIQIELNTDNVICDLYDGMNLIKVENLFSDEDKLNLSEINKIILNKYLNIHDTGCDNKNDDTSNDIDTISTIDIPTTQLSDAELNQYINKITHNLKMCKNILKELKREKTIRTHIMNETIGNRIKKEILRKNLSQRKLAKLTEIPRHKISDICNDKIDMTISQLLNISSVLEVTTDYLIRPNIYNTSEIVITDEELEKIKSLSDMPINSKQDICIFDFKLTRTTDIIINDKYDYYMSDFDIDNIKYNLVGKHLKCKGSENRYATIFKSYTNINADGVKELWLKSFILNTEENKTFIEYVKNHADGNIIGTYKLGSHTDKYFINDIISLCISERTINNDLYI